MYTANKKIVFLHSMLSKHIPTAPFIKSAWTHLPIVTDYINPSIESISVEYHKYLVTNSAFY